MCRIHYPNSAILQDMVLEYTTNISIDEDHLNFDTILSCTIDYTRMSLIETFTQQKHHNGSLPLA